MKKSDISTSLRISVPYEGKSKKSVYATIEAGVAFSSEENSKESRKQAFKQAREELQEEINNLVEEILNPLQADLVG